MFSATMQQLYFGAKYFSLDAGFAQVGVVFVMRKGEIEKRSGKVSGVVVQSRIHKITTV